MTVLLIQLFICFYDLNCEEEIGVEKLLSMAVFHFNWEYKKSYFQKNLAPFLWVYYTLNQNKHENRWDIADDFKKP